MKDLLMRLLKALARALSVAPASPAPTSAPTSTAPGYVDDPHRRQPSLGEWAAHVTGEAWGEFLDSLDGLRLTPREAAGIRGALAELILTKAQLLATVDERQRRKLQWRILDAENTLKLFKLAGRIELQSVAAGLSDHYAGIAFEAAGRGTAWAIDAAL